MPDLSDTLRKCRIGTAKNFTLLLLLYHTQADAPGVFPYSDVVRSVQHLRQHGQQRVDLRVRRGPRGHEPHGLVRGVHAGGRVKRNLLLQPRDLRIRQDGEDLVRRRGHVHCDAAVRERGGDALRLRVRVPAQVEPEVVRHRGGELHAEQAALGEHGAVALHRAAEADALLEKFSHVTKWNEPKKVGRRIYDDKVFYESLSKQRSEGKALSDRQFAALQKLAAKYQL